MLCANQVSCEIDGQVILWEVSLTLRAGEFVGLIGPNGAGKTTLLRVLSGALRPSTGSVTLGQVPLGHLSRRQIAQRIAVVPQQTDLNFDVGALELALMGRHPHLSWFQLEGRDDFAIARGALDTMGATDFEERSVLTLSGGERQRVFLSRGLAQDAGVLLVDEPTTSLDLAHQLQIMETLQRLAREQGLAVLVASHDVHLAARYLDRVVLLSDGRLIADGPAQAVVASNDFERAFGVRIELGAGGGAAASVALAGDDKAGATDAAPDAAAVDADALLEDLSVAGRARKRAEQAAARHHPRRRAQGLVILNTGKGKGKTTAALGLLLRAWGRDMRAVMFQFIKSRTANWGENRAARRLGVEIIPLGDGFTWMSKDIERDRSLAREGWDRCRQALASEEYAIVILDELTYLMKFGWLDVQEVIAALQGRPPAQHVVITGRDAPAELMEFADLVTEMHEVKHPYKTGVRAQPGIEF